MKMITGKYESRLEGRDIHQSETEIRDSTEVAQQRGLGETLSFILGVREEMFLPSFSRTTLLWTVPFPAFLYKAAWDKCPSAWPGPILSTPAGTI